METSEDLLARKSANKSYNCLYFFTRHLLKISFACCCNLHGTVAMTIYLKKEELTCSFCYIYTPQKTSRSLLVLFVKLYTLKNKQELTCSFLRFLSSSCTRLQLKGLLGFISTFHNQISIQLYLVAIYRSSRPEVFCKRGILNNFANLTKKTPVSKSLASGLQLY